MGDEAFGGALLGLLIMGATGITLAVDLDGDGVRAWGEYQAGGSIFLHESNARSDDADLDGIPNTIEAAAEWPPGFQPRWDYGQPGTWRDVLVELVVFANTTQDVAIAEEAMGLAANHLEEFGAFVTWNTTVVWSHEAPKNLTPANLHEAYRYAASANNPYIRQWFIGQTVANGNVSIGGLAVGHTVLLSLDSAYPWRCLLSTDPDCKTHHAAEFLRTVLVHEAAHTLGLCHGHDPACYERLPAAEQDGARRSVMSYEDAYRGPINLTITQRVQLRHGISCLGSDVAKSASFDSWLPKDVVKLKLRHWQPCPAEVQTDPSVLHLVSGWRYAPKLWAIGLVLTSLALSWLFTRP